MAATDTVKRGATLVIAVYGAAIAGGALMNLRNLNLANQQQQAAAARLEARIRALEARRPVDLHVTVDRPEQVAPAVYRVLPPNVFGR